MRFRNARNATRIAAILISGMAPGATPAFSSEGPPFRVDAPPTWTLVSAAADQAIFRADEEAQVTLTGALTNKSAMEWAIGEVERLKATATKPRVLEGAKTLANCRITEGAKIVEVHGRPMATLSADCHLTDGEHVVQVRLNEYAWKEREWLVVAKMENVAHRLGSLARAQFRQVLRTVRVGALPPVVPVRQAPSPAQVLTEIPAPTKTNLPAASRGRAAATTHVSPFFGIVRTAPRGWRSLYDADVRSVEEPKSPPEGILSVYEKRYDGMSAARAYPSTLVLRVWDQEAPGTPLEAEVATAMGSIPESDVIAAPESVMLGSREWITAEFEQEIDAAAPAVLKSKVYATLHKDQRGTDVVVLVKGSSRAEEFEHDVNAFNALVDSMEFRPAKRAKMGALKRAAKKLFGPSALLSSRR